MLHTLRDQVDDALGHCRPCHSGLPALLEAQGVAAALAAQYAIRTPVHLTSDGLERHPIEIEAAVYFCVLEALQNAAKYANATRIDVALGQHANVVTFEVRDDGGGFDMATDGNGTGSGHARPPRRCSAGTRRSSPRRGWARSSADVFP
jgi:signal transduction histidine kinase